MATFTEIYKQELKNKGVLSSLGSSVLKSTKERMDPRNLLFGGKGIISATGQKIFGKGYSAINKPTEKLKSPSNDLLVEQLMAQNMQLAVIGKNTMPLRAMSRDINVMRQNMVKLVKLSSDGGTKAATKADMFFRKQSDEEQLYENMLGRETSKRSPELTKTKTQIKDTNTDSTLGIFTKIILPIALVFGGLTLAITKGIDTIKQSFENISTSIGNVVNSILSSIGLAPKADELIMPVNKPIENIIADLEAIKFDDEGNIVGGLKPTEAPKPEGIKPNKPAPAPAPAPVPAPAPAPEPVPAPAPAPTTPQRVTQPEARTHDVSPTRTPIKTSAPERNAFDAVREAMAGSESKGNYDVTFSSYMAKGGLLNTKNIKNLMMPEKWSEVTLGKSKKLTELTLEELRKYLAYREKEAPGTGASGRYQFMPQTLFGAWRTDKKGNKVWVDGLVQKLGLPMTDKFDKNTQDKLQDLLVGGNIAILKAGKVPITPENIYMAQAIGATGAVIVNKAIREGRGDSLIADVLADGLNIKDKQSYKANLLRHNPQLDGVKAKDYGKVLAKHLVDRGGLSQALVGKNVEGNPTVEAAAASPTVASAPVMQSEGSKAEALASNPQIGSVMSQTAMTNTELKAQTGGKLNVINVATVTPTVQQSSSFGFQQQDNYLNDLVTRMVT